MENDRREDQQPTNPPSSYEASNPSEDRREWERDPADAPRESQRGEKDYDQPPHEGGQPPYESAHPIEGGGQPTQHGPGSGGQMGPGVGPGGGGAGRGRRRGGRGRMSPRDRRMPPPRGGRRDPRERSGPPPYSRPPQGGGTGPAHDDRQEQRYSDLPPEQRSLIMQAKAEVDRIREMLDGVLRDLEDVCEQLTRAEHEKDVAEAEIEQLRDSLRRLQR